MILPTGVHKLSLSVPLTSKCPQWLSYTYTHTHTHPVIDGSCLTPCVGLSPACLPGRILPLFETHLSRIGWAARNVMRRYEMCEREKERESSCMSGYPSGLCVVRPPSLSLLSRRDLRKRLDSFPSPLRQFIGLGALLLVFLLSKRLMEGEAD